MKPIIEIPKGGYRILVVAIILATLSFVMGKCPGTYKSPDTLDRAIIKEQLNTKNQKT